MLIEVMSRERKMVVERSTTGVFYIMAMRVDSQVSWWFTFANILDITAQGAMTQIYYVLTFTAQAVEYLQSLSGGVAREVFRGHHVSAA